METLVRRGIAYVPQVENVFPDLTVRENLAMGGYVRKSGGRERIEQSVGPVSDRDGGPGAGPDGRPGGSDPGRAKRRSLAQVPGADLGADRADPVDQCRSRHR